MKMKFIFFLLLAGISFSSKKTFAASYKECEQSLSIVPDAKISADDKIVSAFKGFELDYSNLKGAKGGLGVRRESIRRMFEISSGKCFGLSEKINREIEQVRRAMVPLSEPLPSGSNPKVSDLRQSRRLEIA